MAVDTFIVYVGVYPDVAAAEADYELVKDLHTEGRPDRRLRRGGRRAARRRQGQDRQEARDATRVGGVLGGGVGLATGLVVALFPFAAIGGGLLAATTGGGAMLGAVAGHAAAGMSREDLKELGEHLDKGQAGLVVVGVADIGAKVEAAMKRRRRSRRRSSRPTPARRGGRQDGRRGPGLDRCAQPPLERGGLQLLHQRGDLVEALALPPEQSVGAAGRLRLLHVATCRDDGELQLHPRVAGGDHGRPLAALRSACPSSAANAVLARVSPSRYSAHRSA